MSNGIIVVSGSKGREYHVNLAAYVCSCADWKNRRTQFDEHDPKRLCKHLVQAVCENGLEGEFAEVDLPSLAKKKKGFPLPKNDSLASAAAVYFGESLSEERLSRLSFLFGGRNRAAATFFRFREDTKNGNNIVYRFEDDLLKTVCQRLCWIGVAESAPEMDTAFLLSGFDLDTLKELGRELDVKPFGQRRTGVRALADHTRLWDGLAALGIHRECFFLLRPLTLRDLG